MRQILRDNILVWLASVTVFAVFAVVFSYVASLRPAISYVGQSEVIPPVMKAGQVVDLCRAMRVERDLELSISRALVRQSCGSQACTETIAFGNLTTRRTPGTLTQCRKLKIPMEATPGQWELHTYVSWVDWPWWHRMEESPVINITVVP